MRGEIMSNIDLRKCLDGNDMLVLDSGSSYEIEVTIESEEVSFYIEDGYDSQLINIYLEDWEQVKEFVDNQIKLLNKHRQHIKLVG